MTALIQSSHLFQRVASFLHDLFSETRTAIYLQFSSLSESGFIPTEDYPNEWAITIDKFSSLSESGFIPTSNSWVHRFRVLWRGSHLFQRVASFLRRVTRFGGCPCPPGSHLFQRVASFLRSRWGRRKRNGRSRFSSLSESGFIPTTGYSKIYPSKYIGFSSLSESGFIPTVLKQLGVRSITVEEVLISFREWLHSYCMLHLSKN